MVRFGKSVVVLLLLCASVYAEESEVFKLKVTQRVQLGQLVRIDVESNIALDSLVIRVREQRNGEDLLVAPDSLLELKQPGSFVFSHPSVGVYTVHASIYSDKQKKILDAYDRIEIVGTVPTPIPPSPVPPTPVPVTEGSKIIVFLIETADDNPARAMLYMSTRSPNNRVYQYLEQKGHQVLILDDDLPMAKQWVDILTRQNKKVPAMIIVDPAKGQSGSVVYVGDIPSTEQELIDVLVRNGA
ncbi:MAG: hypothetical protein QXI61_06995 [Nitrososphaerota archaeon]